MPLLFIIYLSAQPLSSFNMHTRALPSSQYTQSETEREGEGLKTTQTKHTPVAQSDLRLVDTDKPGNPANANDITEQSLMYFENWKPNLRWGSIYSNVSWSQGAYTQKLAILPMHQSTKESQ